MKMPGLITARNRGRLQPALVEQWMAGLNADTPRVKYGCARALREAAAEQPEALYPYFGFFAGLLAHPNKILQWEAIAVLSHLARVDAQHKFDDIFCRYFAAVRGPVMITAANVIRGGGRVASARPEWADRIANEILRVGRARYQTAECREVAIGHAIRVFDEIIVLLRDPEPVVRFVRRQVRSPRQSTRRKAVQFLQRHAGRG